MSSLHWAKLVAMVSVTGTGFDVKLQKKKKKKDAHACEYMKPAQCEW